MYECILHIFVFLCKNGVEIIRLFIAFWCKCTFSKCGTNCVTWWKKINLGWMLQKYWTDIFLAYL